CRLSRARPSSQRPPPAHAEGGRSKNITLASALPDVSPLLRRQIEFIARLHFEGGVPGIDVALGVLASNHVGGMFVGEDAIGDTLAADESAPDLRPGHEEALVAGEAVDDRRLLAVERELVGRIGHLQTAMIANVLPARVARADADRRLVLDRTILLD